MSSACSSFSGCILCVNVPHCCEETKVKIESQLKTNWDPDEVHKLHPAAKIHSANAGSILTRDLLKLDFTSSISPRGFCVGCLIYWGYIPDDCVNVSDCCLWCSTVLQAQAGWTVTYTNRHICAVRGSTVHINCAFTHPSDLIVTSTFWVREDNWANDLKSVPEYSGRVEFVCDNNNNNKCTLIIRNLTESDSDVYMFRIITNIDKERWIGKPGVSLTVTGNVFFFILLRSAFSLWWWRV